MMNTKQIKHLTLATVAAVAVGLALVQSAAADGVLDREALKALFAEKSFVYPHGKEGENAVVFMDRFGGTETYVPCEFSDGKWWVSEDKRLCWQDRLNDPAPRCYAPEVSGETVKLTDAAGTLAYAGKLLEGNRIPTG